MANCITKHIPNTITSCNLLSGCLASLAAIDGNIERAYLFIVLGAIFDFCDGLSARALKAYSPIGKELDSLSDLVTFGLAPSLMIMHLLRQAEWSCLPGFMPYLSLVLVVFAALRLAKFNTDERQTCSFLGLAVPANALFWCGTALTVCQMESVTSTIAWILIALVFIMSALMVSEIPMFSFKFKNLGWKDNKVRFIFIASAILIVVLAGPKGAAIAIVWYILLSLLTQKKPQ